MLAGKIIVQVAFDTRHSQTYPFDREDRQPPLAGRRFVSSSPAFVAITVLTLARGVSMDGQGCWRDNVFVERLWRSVASNPGQSVLRQTA